MAWKDGASAGARWANVLFALSAVNERRWVHSNGKHPGDLFKEDFCSLDFSSRQVVVEKALKATHESATSIATHRTGTIIALDATNILGVPVAAMEGMLRWGVRRRIGSPHGACLLAKLIPLYHPTSLAALLERADSNTYPESDVIITLSESLVCSLKVIHFSGLVF